MRAPSAAFAAARLHNIDDDDDDDDIDNLCSSLGMFVARFAASDARSFLRSIAKQIRLARDTRQTRRRQKACNYIVVLIAIVRARARVKAIKFIHAPEHFQCYSFAIARARLRSNSIARLHNNDEKQGVRHIDCSRTITSVQAARSSRCTIKLQNALIKWKQVCVCLSWRQKSCNTNGGHGFAASVFAAAT